MNLDDLEKVAAREDDKKEEDEFDDDEDTVEADLTNALNLLEDCYQIFDDILKEKDRRKISLYLYSRIKDVSTDVLALTSQYDTVEKDKDKPDPEIIDFDSL
jgi:hypothetical protein